MMKSAVERSDWIHQPHQGGRTGPHLIDALRWRQDRVGMLRIDKARAREAGPCLACMALNVGCAADARDRWGDGLSWSAHVTAATYSLRI